MALHNPSTVYIFSDFTGGTAEDLDSVDGLALTAGDSAFVYKDVGNYVCDIKYVVQDSSATADGITVIEPATNPGTKRWHQTGAMVVTGEDEPTSPFTGLVWIDSST